MCIIRPTLERVRAALREEPALHHSVVKDLLEERPRWPVYRNPKGWLVMFDDYLQYVVAQEHGEQGYP